MRYERVKVKRDSNTVHSKDVAPWEVPVLEFIFEQGNVEPTGLFVEVDREYPDAAREFDRLTKCYSSDPQSGVPYVASVYGNAGVGVRALRKAIEDAAEQDEAAKEEKVQAHAPARKRSRQPQEADSLLG